MSEEGYPKRILTLTGPALSATVTLTLKFGVWWVTAASGSLRLSDFTSKDGWGDTEIAVQRAARRLGATISEATTVRV